MSAVPREPWLLVWVNRCQCVAGRVSHAEPLVLLSEVRRLFTDLPSDIGIVDQCLLRSLLGQVVGRILQAHKVDQDLDIARAVLAFTSCGLTPGRWHNAFTDLLDRSGAVLGVTAASGMAHPHVEHALAVIDTRCVDPHLNLKAVAKAIGLSSFHLSRLLKTHTGEGFIIHLHQRRVSAARKLLTETQMSIKEVAAAVGYRSVSQLGRRFKRVYGLPPVAIRVRLRSAKTRAS